MGNQIVDGAVEIASAARYFERPFDKEANAVVGIGYENTRPLVNSLTRQEPF